jgi:hypothetical protein
MNVSETLRMPHGSTSADAQGALRDVVVGARDGWQAAARDAGQAARDAGQAARDAGQAARDAGLAARDAARQSADAARAAARETRPAQVGENAAIVIPGDNGGEPIKIDIKDGQIIVNQGDKHTTIPWRDAVPRGAVQMTYAISSAIVAIAFVGPLLRFFLRRYERRAITTTLSREVQARLDAMDRNIDTVALEMERVSEGQRFTAKLLEQRPMEHAQRIDR